MLVAALHSLEPFLQQAGVRLPVQLRALPAHCVALQEESGVAPFLLPSLAAVAGCWLLSGVL